MAGHCATDASTSLGSPGSSATQSLSIAARPSGRALTAPAAVRAPCGTPPVPSNDDDREPCLIQDEEQYDDDVQRSDVTIADRIEGIRACLEARLGTDRFQKLYRSLSLAEGVSPTASQELGLLKEAFAEADGCGNDAGSLAPLVAKFVDCEQAYFS